MPAVAVAAVRVAGLLEELPSQAREMVRLVVELQRPVVLSVLQAAVGAIQQLVLVFVLVLQPELLVNNQAHRPMDMVAEQPLGNRPVSVVVMGLEGILRLQAQPVEQGVHIEGIQALHRWVSVLHREPEVVLRTGLLPVLVVRVKLQNGKQMQSLLRLVVLLLRLL